MSSNAFLKNYRVSPRKARLLADQIRGKGVDEALTLLDLSS
jgi:large subunit ribosomal protein L22